MTIHERRAGRRRRERILKLSPQASRYFCRGMRLVSASGIEEKGMTVFRVDYLRCELYVTVPVWP